MEPISAHSVPRQYSSLGGPLPLKKPLSMNGILERAAARGLATEFRDAFGRTRTVAPEVLARLLEAFPEAEITAGILPRSVVFRDRADRTIRLDVPRGLPISWTLTSERGLVAEGQAVSPSVTLPPELPNGIFRLVVTVTTPSARRRAPGKALHTRRSGCGRCRSSSMACARTTTGDTATSGIWHG